MKKVDKRMKEIKESLNRINTGLQSFIINHQHLFNAKSYEKWAEDNRIGSPKRVSKNKECA